jgi:glycosyltransferase involved in cell wall biosynthesis
VRGELAIVVHEATRTGAPIFALRFARWLRRCSGTETVFVLLNDGSLLPEFWKEFACVPLFALPHKDRAAFMRTQLRDLRLLYLNSLASLRAWEWLDWYDGALLLHVHESPASLRCYSTALTAVAAAGPCVIAVNNSCHAPLAELLGTQPHIIPPAIEPPPLRRDRRRGIRPTVVGLGTISRRKGADLFCYVAAKVVERIGSEVDFVWIGGPGDVEIQTLLDHLGMSRRIRIAGEVADPLPLLAAASVLMLPSREDPFPLAALEAASCGVPVVCFDALADGVGTFISAGAGDMVPAFDVDAMADAVARLLNDAVWRRSASVAASHAVREFHVDMIGHKIGKIINQLVGYNMIRHVLALVLLFFPAFAPNFLEMASVQMPPLLY